MVNFRTAYRAKSPDGCDSFGDEGSPYGSLSTWQAISTRISADRTSCANALGCSHFVDWSRPKQIDRPTILFLRQKNMEAVVVLDELCVLKSIERLRHRRTDAFILASKRSRESHAKVTVS